jgi:drug/metabolite transporter (DMT)-like permease
VRLQTAIALVLAVLSTTLTNVAYSREHDAAAALPELSFRHPLRSVRLLLTDHNWLVGFALESTGFLCYAAAVGLASLALVQSIGAGGIGVLAFATARVSKRHLTRRQLAGVGFSILGLAALGVSLIKNSGEGKPGSIPAVLAWVLATLALALLALRLGRRRNIPAVADGVAGGLFFSVGDFSTKLATQGGVRSAFVVTLIIGYAMGTSLLQLGYQQGTALTVAGLATLLTNALPILAGTIVLKEPVPTGAFGAARVLAFVAVTAGAVLLARPERHSASAAAAAT